ncbi:MAG: MFS transporter [Candidatus Pacebacteria bacterium]|nr:MFS transporter [Candidatus Paceibacterota bacterium]
MSAIKKVVAKKNLKLLYFLALLLAISTALPTYIQSNFLEGFIGVSMVGLFFVLANVISFFCILIFPRFIRRVSNFNLAMTIGIISLVALLGLSFSSNIFLILIFFIFATVASALIWINMDLFVESFSNNAETGKIRTLFFTFMNAGWIISPVLAGYLSQDNTYSQVYLVAALALLPFLILLFSRRQQLKNKTVYDRMNLSQTFIFLRRNLNLRGIFVIALLLQIFYSAAVVFIPLYLHQYIGFSWNSLGLMFSIMLVPFVLLEFPAGVLADKYWGEKEILSFGLFVLILSLALFYITSSTSIFVWTALLFLSRVGASLVESMRETYFFKIVDIENLQIINLFRTTGPLGYLVGSAIGATITLLLPLKFIFIFVAVILLIGFYYIYTIEDTK